MSEPAEAAPMPPRREPGYRPRENRLRDYRAVELPLDQEEVARQASRCMDCGTPFCLGCGCPLGNLIPEFNDHVRRRRWKEAWEILSAHSPFPEFTGQVCPAPCETACVSGLHGEAISIRQIERFLVEYAFENGLVKPPHPPARRGATVAIVGSGPAGLAAAWSLQRAGYPVTVYENAPKPGGILRYGIPDFKLEKSLVDRRIDLMKQEGVRFETGVEIGRDLSARYLHGRFDAVILTGGAREPRDLHVPGRDLRGIHFAMPFLTQQNRRLDGDTPAEDQAIHAAGRNVAVLGGGDTGSDCLGTALRQGALQVCQFEILPRPPDERAPDTPWPEWPRMLRESSSHQEGGERRWSVSVKRFEGQNGRVAKLHGMEVEWTDGANGRPAPRDLPGTEFSWETDLVLIAMGFVGPGQNRYVEELELTLDERGFIRRDEKNRTSEPRVFVAGDMARGASLVAHALAEGLHCARCVREMLEQA